MDLKLASYSQGNTDGEKKVTAGFNIISTVPTGTGVTWSGSVSG
jgi:hypothetical protein